MEKIAEVVAKLKMTKTVKSSSTDEDKVRHQVEMPVVIAHLVPEFSGVSLLQGLGYDEDDDQDELDESMLVPGPVIELVGFEQDDELSTEDNPENQLRILIHPKSAVDLYFMLKAYFQAIDFDAEDEEATPEELYIKTRNRETINRYLQTLNIKTERESEQ